jgi:hypothetical protein
MIKSYHGRLNIQWQESNIPRPKKPQNRQKNQNLIKKNMRQKYN